MIARILAGLATLFIIASCGSRNNDAAVSGTPADTAVHQAIPDSSAISRQHIRNQITDSMLAQVIDYYHKEYGSDSIRMEITRSDTLVELTFEDTTGGPDDYTGALFLADISLVTDVNPVISGDMNGDGVNDMLVTVHTEGGGGGGNVWWDDHFLFLAKPDGESTLADVKSDGEIMDGSGYFFPKEISNQVITGTGNGYAESDGHCCPSLYYRMHVRLANGKLTTLDKTSIAKPAEFE